MPTRHCRRCLIADHISVHGLEMVNHCERCLARGVSCKVDLSSGRCSECVRVARSCSLVRSEVERKFLPSRRGRLLTLTRSSRGGGTEPPSLQGTKGRGRCC